MKTLKTATLNKPSACGASWAESKILVASLSDDELILLAEMLREKYPERFGP